MINRLGMLGALCLVAPAVSAAQGGVHVLVVTGVSGEPAAAKRFAESAKPVIAAATTKWGVTPANLTYLAEDPTTDKRITGKATKEEIAGAFKRIAAQAKPGDLVLVFVVGHGSGERDSSKVSISGPDPTARDYATMLNQLEKQRVVFIVAASGSGDFVPVLSGKDRAIITATKTALERNESHFSVLMGKGLTDEAADADKDGEISVLEAFTFARTETAKLYTTAGTMQTEHSQLDDNGDSKATAEPTADTDDGPLSKRITFGGVAATNPKAAALMAERRVLESEVEALRAKKTFMPPAQYDKELERLLIAIAEKTAEIRALEPVRKP